MSDLVRITELYKHYENGLIPALDGVSLTLERGLLYALMGPSGCGKSTLLNLLGTLDVPTSGHIKYEDQFLSEIRPVHKFRRECLGFVFQFHHLIPVLTLRENVESALLPDRNITASQRRERATQILDDLGILHRADSYSTKLSGGERQRGAIARALINKPNLLLADEPTGNVDSKNATVILRVLRNHVTSRRSTMLIATHDQAVAEIADVQIRLEDGKVVSIERNRFTPA